MMDFPNFWTTSFISTVTIFTLIYFHFKRRFQYWKKRGIPYAIPKFPYGNSEDSIRGRRHMGFVLHDIYKQYSDEKVIGFFNFLTPTIMVRDPELINRILIKDFNYFRNRSTPIPNEKLDPLEMSLVNLRDKQWKEIRKKLIPTFSQAKLRLMYDSLNGCVDELDELVASKYANTGQPVDIGQLMSQVTMDIIGSCAFGLSFNTLKDPNSEFRIVGSKFFASSWRTKLLRVFAILDGGNGYLANLFSVRSIDPAVERFFFSFTEDTLRQREIENEIRNDFVQLMIEIQKKEKKFHNTDSYKFTDNMFAANTMVFFAAGFATSSMTLTYVLYELALHQNFQNKLRDEVKKHCNGSFTYENITSTEYLDMVVMETMRKHPPAAFTSRLANDDYPVPGTPYVIEKGISVVIPIYGVHHDPAYYPEPDVFNPDRFTGHTALMRPSSFFLPFGDGPRSCIGIRFAKLEMECVLAHIISKFQFDICEKTEIPIRILAPSPLLAPKNAVFLSIKLAD